MERKPTKLKSILGGLSAMVLVVVFCQLVVWPLISKPPVAKAQVEKELPVVGSVDNLLKLLEDSQSNYPRYYGMMRGTAKTAAGSVDMINSAEINDKAAPVPAAPAADQSVDFSQTNTQVQGVDEADLLKTDGKYIYQVNKSQVLIIKAMEYANSATVASYFEKPLFTDSKPTVLSDMNIVSRINFDDANFTPAEIYLDENQLVVIGNSYIETEPLQYSPNNSKMRIMPPYPRLNHGICRAIVYNIADRSKVSKVRELDLEGNYLSSRKIGTSMYLIANQYIDYYYIQQGQEVSPTYRDTVKGNSYISQDLGKIKYFPGCIQPNYLSIAALDLAKSDQPADIKSYLGSGENIYASNNNLYVALTQYKNPEPLPAETFVYRPAESSTRIFKFALNGSSLSYIGDGEVPGTVLNQFSIDENGDYCRIATTSGEVWRNDEYTSQNNIYILDQELQIAGRLENIAPGEKIYSTRFMGDRAYMVTFRTVDPFFVLDLKDPKNPKILGKLKIPGYSDYLHPYDENHIIGFGKDTIELKNGENDSRAFYQGMKVAIFDVSDVNNPVEMSKQIIGDRGTDSDLLRDHKALLFSRDKKILAFPVTVMKVNQTEQQKSADFPAYGSFAFQGAYIYSIDLVNGLQLKGQITHLDDEDYLKAGDYWYDAEKSIQRVFYIGNVLYTISPGKIKANDMSTLQEIQSLSLEQ